MMALPARSDDAKAAQGLLKAWNWRLDGHGRADALAAILMRAGQKWHYQRLPRPDPADALATAAAYLRTHFGRLDPPLGTVLRIAGAGTSTCRWTAPQAPRAASLRTRRPMGGWSYATATASS
ncbi:hypothetical protein AB5I41_10555 [Sphingomonas sp. MMS24-JH45]